MTMRNLIGHWDTAMAMALLVGCVYLVTIG